MEVINNDKVASVALAEVRVSADELALYEAALSHLLDDLEMSELEGRFGASRDEVEGMRERLRDCLTRHGATSRKPVSCQAE